MFIMHISAVMAYLGMTAGAALIVWSLRHSGPGSSLGNFIGSLVLIFSLLSTLCIGYYGVKYWAQGAYESSEGMSMKKPKEMVGQMGMDQMGKMEMENLDDQHLAPK